MRLGGGGVTKGGRSPTEVTPPPRRNFLASHDRGWPGSMGDFLRMEGCQRRVAASAASFLVVPGMVGSSDLVAVVPRRLLRTAGPSLDVMEVPWLSESFEVALIWHERSQGHQGHRWIRELVHDLTAG